HPRVRILAIMRLGSLRPLTDDETIDEKTTLILAATMQDLDAYGAEFGKSPEAERPVLILGGGKVGQAAAQELARIEVPYTIVESVPGKVPSHLNVVEGDAGDHETLRSAGLDEASAVLVATPDDDLNVYLTLYCRRLRPELQVITRATYERNVATQYRAGADSVLSYATIGATALWNQVGLDHRVVIAEGNELFPVPIPRSLAAPPCPTAASTTRPVAASSLSPTPNGPCCRTSNRSRAGPATSCCCCSVTGTRNGPSAGSIPSGRPRTRGESRGLRAGPAPGEVGSVRAWRRGQVSMRERAPPRDLRIEFDTETGGVGHADLPVLGHRLAQQHRREHRHDLLSRRMHHQEFAERAVGAGDHEVVRVHRGAVRHHHRPMGVGERGDLDQLGDPSAPAHVGLDDVGGAHLQQLAEAPPGGFVLTGGDQHARGDVP